AARSTSTSRRCGASWRRREEIRACWRRCAGWGTVCAMGRQELLLALLLLFLLGVGATVARVLEARRTGLSLRLQVFIPLAATTLLLAAMFAVIVIDRFTARASLFAFRAAEDEARAIAELAARTPAESLRPILQAFTRSAIDTDVAFLDGEGHVVLEAGQAHPG